MNRLGQSWLSPAARWSLADRLTFAMLIVAVIAITVLFFDLNASNRVQIEALQSTALHNSAQDLAQVLDALIADEKRRVANLALSRSAQEFASVRPDQRSALFTPTLADFTNFLDSNRPFYRAVLLLDTAGEVLIATDGSYVGRRFRESAFFQAARRGVTYMSDPGISPLDRQPVIWLAAPVTPPQRSPAATLSGVIAVALAPEEIWQAVERVRIGEGGYALLLDRYGIRLAHGADRRYVFRSLVPLPPAIWAKLQTEERFANLTQLATTNSQELFDYVQREPLPPLWIGRPGPAADRVYYSAVRLQARDWTVIAMLSEHEVLAPAAKTTLRGLMATVLVVLLLSLTVAWTARLLARPLPRLAAAAARIASGDFSAPITVQGSAEIRGLAANFETMRQRLALAQRELAAWTRTLEQRVALRSQELAALSEVVALASRNQSRPELLQLALNRALTVMGAEIGGIWLADAAGKLQLNARAGFDRDLDAELTSFAPGEGLLGRVQQHGEPLVLDDISQSPQLSRAIVREEGLHAFAAVPLSVSGRTLGVLGFFSHSQQGFSPEAVATATAIGQQIALTLDNIALLAQLQTQARSVAALHERERIAGEIHDGIAQNLSYLYLQLDQLAEEVVAAPAEATRLRLLQLEELLATTTGEVRQLIARLQRVAPPPRSLAQHLQDETARLARELSLQVDLRITAQADLTVASDVSTELSRIVGESLRNARHHGGATQVQVEFQRQNGHGYVRVRDNGKGFDPGQHPVDERGHFGLSVMEARARRIGGRLAIRSGSGKGAEVEVCWPLVREEEAA